jgi:hypothetical protein
VPKGHVRWVDAPPPRTASAKPKPVFTCDDIEGEEWFARMPAAAQKELRDRLKGAALRGEQRAAFARDTLKRSMAQGVGLFLVTEVFFAMPSVWHWLAAIPFGAAVGALWHARSAGRFQAMGLAILPWLLLRALFLRTVFDAALVVLAFGVMASLAAMIGHEREHRRADDLDF